MEGGGERKRKGGPIEIDFDKLLSSCDNDGEPPEVVIQKSKPQVVVMVESEEEERQMNRRLEHMPEKELIETIARMESLSKTCKLNDGGEKLRASLKKHEAELERRKYLKKDDSKCMKAALLRDECACNGATDNLSSHGAPPSEPASQSAFALRFCSKLDDERATKSFGEELSILSRSDHKTMREHVQFSAQRTKKIGLSSRQAPFKSPSHLSSDTANIPQSIDKRWGCHSSDPSSHQSDNDASGCFKKKGSASHGQRPPNSRSNNQKTVVLVDEEELEVDAVDEADDVGQSGKETRIYYPSRDDPEAIEICYSDMKCLEPESYLSSTIMNFYIRYLQKPTSPRAGKRCDYHFFNTYFYEKLKQDVLTKADKETSFLKFRRWWKGVNIFEKAYIFLPIHENLHWSLVIVCIPNKEDESGPIILHLDSLGMHISRSIFNNVKSFLIEEWKVLRQEEVLPELPIPDNIWDKLSRRIGDKVIEVPQQRNEYDCGLFVLFFMERFIEEAPKRLKKEDLEMFGRQWFRPEEASSLRRKIRKLLREEFRNANEGTSILDS